MYLLKALDIFLRFSKVNIHTDCRSILFLKAAKGNNEIFNRYAIEIAAYDISITHIPGKENSIADALSRSRKTQHPDQETSYMSQNEATILMELLCVPEGKTFSVEEVKRILLGTGLPSLMNSNTPKSRRKKPQAIPITAF